MFARERGPHLRRIAAGVLVTGSLALAIAGVGAQTPPSRQSPYTKQLPPGEGMEIVGEKCRLCHSTMLITQQRKDSLGWVKTVTQMQKWGARMLADDHKTVIDYLLRNFGAAAK